MAKKSPAEHAWSIFRIRKTPAELRVCAPDQDTAIRKAIELLLLSQNATDDWG
jgi:hypothetical protein